MSIFKKNNGNNVIIKFNGKKLVKKSIKLKKLVKSQKSAKSWQKQSKSQNLSKFDVKKAGPSILIWNAKIILNCL